MGDIKNEIAETVLAGAILMNYDELKNQLDKLGYKIDQENSFNYFNSANKNQYNARSCYIVEKDTGIGFANIKSRKDENFNKLQQLRKNALVIDRNRIIEF